MPDHRRSRIRLVVRHLALALVLLAAPIAAPAQELSSDELIARARKRDAEAEYILGMRAYTGQGLPRDPGQALRLVERAAQHGLLEAQNTYGFFLQHGVGTAPDPARARPWFEAAAARGHPIAQVNLGWLYEHGVGVDRSPALALEWYRKAAAKGVAEAEFNIGSLLASGSPPDFAAAAAAYARAAQQDLPLARDRLGQLIEAGHAPRAEYGSALGQYLSAARAGVADAQVSAARLELATGGAENARDAVRWLESASKQQHAGARAMLADAPTQFRIARQLASNAPAGETEALPWLRRAADQGYRDAQLRLGIALNEGRGTARDPAAAAPWYRKAGDAGEPEALFRLALLYDEGTGVGRDTVRARDLLGQAASLGHEGAKERLDALLGAKLPQLQTGDPFKGLR